METKPFIGPINPPVISPSLGDFLMVQPASSPLIVRSFDGMPREEFQALADRAQSCAGEASACIPLIKQLLEIIHRTDRERKSYPFIHGTALNASKEAALLAAGGNYASKQAINTFAQQALNIQEDRDRLLREKLEDITELANLAIEAAGIIPNCTSLIKLLAKKGIDFADRRDSLIREVDAQPRSALQKETDQKVLQVVAFYKHFENVPVYCALSNFCDVVHALLFEQPELSLKDRQLQLSVKWQEWMKASTERDDQCKTAQLKVKALTDQRFMVDGLLGMADKRAQANWEMENVLAPLISLTDLLAKAKEITLDDDQWQNLQAEYQKIAPPINALCDGQLTDPPMDIKVSQAKARELRLELEEELDLVLLQLIINKASGGGFCIFKAPSYKYSPVELVLYADKHYYWGEGTDDSYVKLFHEVAGLKKKWEELSKKVPTLDSNKLRRKELDQKWEPRLKSLRSVAAQLDSMEDWLRSLTRLAYSLGVKRCSRYQRWLDQGPPELSVSPTQPPEDIKAKILAMKAPPEARTFPNDAQH